MHKLIEQQNSTLLNRLLRASVVAYSQAKSWETTITYLLLTLSILYPISYLIIKAEPVKITLFGCSFFITILLQVISGTLKDKTYKGAIIKEEFDTILFNLPWKSTLNKLDHNEVSKLATRYHSKPIKNWYSTKLNKNIPTNTAIAVFQHSNTSWDIELRRKFMHFLKFILILYTLILFSIFIILKIDGLTIFFIAFSVLSFYTHFISLIRGHSSVINKREKISNYLDSLIVEKKELSLQTLRDVQDEIYQSRLESAKVPDFFFRIMKKQMNLMTEDYITSVNSIYM